MMGTGCPHPPIGAATACRREMATVKLGEVHSLSPLRVFVGNFSLPSAIFFCDLCVLSWLNFLIPSALISVNQRSISAKFFLPRSAILAHVVFLRVLRALCVRTIRFPVLFEIESFCPLLGDCLPFQTPLIK